MLPVSSWGPKWASRVQSVTEDQFCAKRAAEGFPRNLCAQQYQIWRQKVAGKEQAYNAGILGQVG